MDLATLKVRVREAVLERATDTGLIADDPELVRWINAANREVFNEAVKANPRPWIERSGDLAYANPLAFSAIIAAPAKVRSVHLVAAKSGSGYVKLTPSEEGFLDDSDIDPSFPTASGLPVKWFTEGLALWLAPPPAAAQVLKVWFVRQLALLAADVDEPLGGKVPDDLHDVIVWKAAQLLYRKDEVLNTPWDKSVDDGLRALRSALARNQGQRTRRVRPSSHFPNTRRRR